MKKIILLLSLVAFTFLCNAQEDSTQVSEKSPIEFSVRVSHLMWDNKNITEAYENFTLFGGGFAMFLSDDFKVSIAVDYGSKEKDSYTMDYIQIGASIKYSWYVFGSDRPNVYGGLGAKKIFLKETGNGETEKGDSFGFCAMIGIEIPIREKTILDFGWNTVWCDLEIYEENIDIGSQIFYGGLIFNL